MISETCQFHLAFDQVFLSAKSTKYLLCADQPRPVRPLVTMALVTSISEIYGLATAKDHPRVPLGSRYLHHSPWLPDEMHDSRKKEDENEHLNIAPFHSIVMDYSTLATGRRCLCNYTALVSFGTSVYQRMSTP